MEPREGQFKFDNSWQQRKKFAPDSHVTVIQPLKDKNIPEKTEDSPEASHHEFTGGSGSVSVQRSQDEAGRDMFEGHSLQYSHSNLLPGYQSGNHGFGIAFSKDPGKARQRAFNRAETQRLENTKDVKTHMERSASRMKEFQKNPTPVIKIDSSK